MSDQLGGYHGQYDIGGMSADQSDPYSGAGGGGGSMGFQTFQYGAPGEPSGNYGGGYLIPGPAPDVSSAASLDELPLLEELGINPEHILQKTLSVLNPLRATDLNIMRDTDLAGPLCFCLAFGAFLLLSGKVHFGYIYGIGVMGCLSMFGLLNVMSQQGVGIGVVVSVLGYCLLPMVILSGVAIVFSLQGVLGMLTSGLSVLWCSISASKLFVTALSMDSQQPLVAYPCMLLYAVFALLTVF